MSLPALGKGAVQGAAGFSGASGLIEATSVSTNQPWSFSEVPTDPAEQARTVAMYAAFDAEQSDDGGFSSMRNVTEGAAVSPASSETSSPPQSDRSWREQQAGGADQLYAELSLAALISPKKPVLGAYGASMRKAQTEDTGVEGARLPMQHQITQMTTAAEDGWRLEHAESLARRSRTAVHGRQKVTRGIDSQIAMLAKDFLPLEFMFQHKMYNYCNEKGMAIIVKTFGKLVNKFWQMAFERWVHWMSAHRRHEKITSATTVQRNIRAYLARQNVTLLLKRRQTKSSVVKRFTTRAVQQRLHYAECLQAAYRGRVAYLQVVQHKMDFDAAVMLQKSWRARNGWLDFLMKKREHIEQDR
jgi:hypothetical protein